MTGTYEAFEAAPGNEPPDYNERDEIESDVDSRIPKVPMSTYSWKAKWNDDESIRQAPEAPPKAEMLLNKKCYCCSKQTQQTIEDHVDQKPAICLSCRSA